MKIWLKQPAAVWSEGFPIGTGRLAAMVFGTYLRERIALNHEWLWKGVNRGRDTEVKSHLLPGIREMLLNGKYEEGTRAANEVFAGLGGMSGKTGRVDPYQPAGDLFLEFNHGFVNGYKRELDLDTACATVAYNTQGGRHVRQYVAHCEKDILLIRVTKNGAPFNCTAWLDRNYDPDCELSIAGSDNAIRMTGQIKGGVDFLVVADVRVTGGRMRLTPQGRLFLEGVTEAIFTVNMGVSVNGKSAADECAVSKPVVSAEWENLLQDHVRAYQCHRSSFSLEVHQKELALPTDERLRFLRVGKPDPMLALLYFHYGRYLLFASSVKATLPANLQGKWNEEIKPLWECDYHHDINLQMNYWMAEEVGDGHFMEPFFQYVERFIPHARKAAQDLYGCRGVLFPLQTDAWSRATPESFGWAVWIGAASWLAQHFWWHYEFGLDQDFLRTRAYPFFKEIAAFYEDYLVKDADGQLQIVPSQSPENTFAGGGNFPVTLCVSSTMDVVLARDAFHYALCSAEILGVDQERQRKWKEMMVALPPLQVGKDGRLLEWNKAFTETEPYHRHVSHLIGAFPGNMLSPEETLELWQAAEKSLVFRLSGGEGFPGWSHAWAACLFARFGRAEKAWNHLERLISESASNSLLNVSFPGIFNIDANLGAPAAVLEMLLQSHHNVLHFLPALPAAWPEGCVKGLHARGGFTVGIEWRGGQLTHATLMAKKASPCVIFDHQQAFKISDSKGLDVPFMRTGKMIIFETHADAMYIIQG